MRIVWSSYLKNTMRKQILLVVIFSVFYFIMITYLESKVISPMILNKDYCYYHTHETPFLVELFYMSPASNGHPDGSFFQLFFILFISVTFGYFTKKIVLIK